MADKGLEQLLHEIEQSVLGMKGRLDFLKVLAGRLEAVSLDGRFLISNDIIYKLVTDSYEMLIIDLASFCRGLVKRGGFLNRLNNHLKALRRPNRKRNRTEPWLADEEQRYADTAFERLFPKSRDGKVRQTDIQQLKDRVDADTDRVKQLRDDVHAHRYEGSGKTLKRLSLEEVSTIFAGIERMLKDVRLLALNSSFAFEPPTYASPNDTADDIRDLILQGTVNRFFVKLAFARDLKKVHNDPQPYYHQRRDNYYQGAGLRSQQATWPWAKPATGMAEHSEAGATPKALDDDDLLV